MSPLSFCAGTPASLFGDRGIPGLLTNDMKLPWINHLTGCALVALCLLVAEARLAAGEAWVPGRGLHGIHGLAFATLWFWSWAALALLVTRIPGTDGRTIPTLGGTFCAALSVPPLSVSVTG